MPPCYDPVAKKDCEKRVVGCHDTCEKWKAWEEVRNAGYEKRKERLMIGVTLSAQKQKSYYKSLMKRRK